MVCRVLVSLADTAAPRAGVAVAVLVTEAPAIEEAKRTGTL